MDKEKSKKILEGISEFINNLFIGLFFGVVTLIIFASMIGVIYFTHIYRYDMSLVFTMFFFVFILIFRSTSIDYDNEQKEILRHKRLMEHLKYLKK